MSSFIAAHRVRQPRHQSDPLLIALYSMFGFQRTGDFALGRRGHAHLARFLMGGYLCRTTLAGEGLQHQGRATAHLLAANIPTCVPTIPPSPYEMAVIVQDGF